MDTNLKRISLLLMLGLAACDGPWNMSVEEHSSTQSLWVSSFQVARRPFDTVWIEGVNPFSTAHDPTSRVLDDGGKVWIIDSAGPGARDSIPFRMLAGTPAAWIPEAGHAGDTVRLGSHLLLRAEVSHDGESHSLSARTYTSSRYGLGPTLGVPLEALHPRLADGSWRDSIKAAVAAGDDAGLAAYAARINGALDSTWAVVTVAQLRSYAAGEAVMFDYPARKGVPTNRLWYVTDPASVRPHPSSASQTAISAYSRQWIIRQPSRGADYGGTAMLQRFDTARAYIVNPIQKQLQGSLGKTDSVGYFQRGDTRLLQVAPAFGGSTPGWPDSILISGFFWSHTGTNRFLSYSIDSLYYEFYSSLSSSGDGQAYHYTNVKGGNGYFTGAVLDSVSFDLETTSSDTFAFSHLRKAWCDKTHRSWLRGESTGIPRSQLEAYCPEFTWSN